MIELHPGDNRDSLRRLIDEGVRVHSVVTDPPYGLVSIQKRFGKENAAPALSEKNDGSFARLSGGFMGKQWDATEIERDPEFWKLVYDILLPGGYVFAFSGSRTGHWQACAMEMAGFIMHPMHGWCYGSGFPKAHAADKAIDKHLGVERPIHGYADVGPDMTGDNYGRDGGERRISAITSAGTPEAAEWEGWAYGTQSQKPALEPIYLGQKPFSEKTGAANILKHGVGAVNIDGCRVPTTDDVSNHSRGSESARSKGIYGDSSAQDTHQTAGQALGRYPSNLILDGSPEVVAMFPNTKSGKPGKRRKSHATGSMSGTLGTLDRTEVGFGDEGSAARFFHHFPPDTYPLIYHAKAGKADRAGGKHPTVKPIGLIQYLIRHITPPGGTVLDPFAGSGTTAEAAIREGKKVILMEAEPEYVDFLTQRFSAPRNSHSVAFEVVEKNKIGTFPLTENEQSEILVNKKTNGPDWDGAFDLSELLSIESSDLSELLA